MTFPIGRVSCADTVSAAACPAPCSAARAGVSEHAVKAFEWGKRRPREATLNAIIDALGLTREEANPIRIALGFPDDWYAMMHERFLPGEHRSPGGS